jgi:Fe-S-cluster containining protein
MFTTKLKIEDKLPLTCSRTGTCCHGNNVFLNPWELAYIAREKNLSPKEFQDQYCDFEGIRLRFNGKEDLRSKSACNQYLENFGCSVHKGRPLACRLFPLGRQIQNEQANYVFQGEIFPCLDGCAEVTKLPHLSVGEYIKGQCTGPFEQAQDHYLEVMQNIADIAFTLLLDTDLVDSRECKTLASWRTMGTDTPEELSKKIGTEWMESLLLPSIKNQLDTPVLFIQEHNEILQEKAQQKFSILQSYKELHDASVQMMGAALLLARALGTDPQALVAHWIEIAKENGATER